MRMPAASAAGLDGGDLRCVVGADARPWRSRDSAARRASLRGADHLVADQDVGDAAPGQRLGLRHLLHALPDRAARASAAARRPAICASWHARAASRRSAPAAPPWCRGCARRRRGRAAARGCRPPPRACRVRRAAAAAWVGPPPHSVGGSGGPASRGATARRRSAQTRTIPDTGAICETLNYKASTYHREHFRVRDSSRYGSLKRGVEADAEHPAGVDRRPEQLDIRSLRLWRHGAYAEPGALRGGGGHLRQCLLHIAGLQCVTHQRTLRHEPADDGCLQQQPPNLRFRRAGTHPARRAAQGRLCHRDSREGLP